MRHELMASTHTECGVHGVGAAALPPSAGTKESVETAVELILADEEDSLLVGVVGFLVVRVVAATIVEGFLVVVAGFLRAGVRAGFLVDDEGFLVLEAGFFLGLEEEEEGFCGVLAFFFFFLVLGVAAVLGEVVSMGLSAASVQLMMVVYGFCVLVGVPRRHGSCDSKYKC